MYASVHRNISYTYEVHHTPHPCSLTTPTTSIYDPESNTILMMSPNVLGTLMTRNMSRLHRMVHNAGCM